MKTKICLLVLLCNAIHPFKMSSEMVLTEKNKDGCAILETYLVNNKIVKAVGKECVEQRKNKKNELLKVYSSQRILLFDENERIKELAYIDVLSNYIENKNKKEFKDETSFNAEKMSVYIANGRPEKSIVENITFGNGLKVKKQEGFMANGPVKKTLVGVSWANGDRAEKIIEYTNDQKKDKEYINLYVHSEDKTYEFATSKRGNRQVSYFYNGKLIHTRKIKMQKIKQD